jgi:primosomal protein N' (replication factor Y)
MPKLIFYQIAPLTALPYSQPQSYTYSFKGNLEIGQLVKINFANRDIFGVVATNTPPTPSDRGETSTTTSVASLIGGVGGIHGDSTKILKTPYLPYKTVLTEKARANRKTPTEAEKKIWREVLRNKQFENYKFRRQKPLDKFIVDFYCPKLMLAIEIDGESHGEQKDYDANRTKILEQYGIQVVRYANENVMKNIEGVFQDLLDKVGKRKKELKNITTPPSPPLSGGGAATAKIKPITKIIENVQLTHQQIELAKKIADYYHTSLGLVLRLMIPPVLKRPQAEEGAKRMKVEKNNIKLTAEQKKIIEDIKKSKTTTHLLYGITGSGKTEIYLQLIKDAIKQNQQSIVLVPEISLTPQAIERYSVRFGQDKVVVVHSNLSNSEKFLAWQKIKNNEAKIIIGPRSAIFSPVKNLAYIILDEEHDPSYKQYDQNPRYHAKKVAIDLAEIFNAKVILGSATPSVDSYYLTTKDSPLTFPPCRGGYGLHRLIKRISGDEMPRVEIVDMRDEFKKGNFSVFSDVLQEKIKQNLNQEKQIILYLNRRGAATFVSCRDCGFVEKCPNCDMPLTYHLNNSNLICHHCGFNKTISLQCPNCQSTAFKYFGAGTQKVEAELTKLFPIAKILRMDRDTTQTRESHQKLYQQFKNHQYDILIGTQMITKGWDLPNIGLVGIISADTALNLPDFRASERTFQLITQVAGRTGRGEEVGEVILQTYSPNNFVIQAAAKHDFEKFYQEEIASRENLGYPPFTRLIKLFFRHPKQKTAEEAANNLFNKLLNRSGKMRNLTRKDTESAIELLGPSPAFIPRIRNNFIYQIIIKIKKTKININKLLNDVPNNWIIDIDPESLL